MKRFLTLVWFVVAAISVPAAAQLARSRPQPQADCTSDLCAFVAAWMSPDASTTTAALLATLNALDNGLVQSPNPQETQQINQIVLGGATLDTLPNANDLVYSTLLGQPYFANRPVMPLNYIVNASSANRVHVLPGSPGRTWSGREADQIAYANYVNTVLAVESFNAYVLNSQAGDLQSSLPTHQQLLAQAADPSAAAAIASEDIGPVLRQLLIVERQNLALLSELVQSQKQLVTAQAMTNALLIATSPVESQLLAKATGAQASQVPPRQAP